MSLYHIQFKKTNLKRFSNYNLNEGNFFHNESIKNNWILTSAML